MGAVDLISNLLFPPKCANCGELFKVNISEKRTSPLCDTCRRRYESERLRECETCGLTMSFCRCMPINMRRAQCSSLIKLTSYRPNDDTMKINDFICSVKHCNDKVLFEFIAYEIRGGLISEMRAMGLMPEDCVIAFVPRTRKNLVSEGFDQGRLLAEALSSVTGIKAVNCFSRSIRSREQKNLNSTERRLNMTGAFRSRRVGDALAGKTVIIVDDIVTTGSSMAACARIAYSMGAYSVIGACIGRTENVKNN